MPDLDALDLALLTALRENPRAGALALSRLTRVARATVESRLSRLERSGVITGYGPDIDVAAAGFTVTAFVTLEIAQGALEAVKSDLAAIPAVLEAYAVTGSADMICRVAATSHADLQQTLLRIDSSPSVARSTSAIALSTVIAPRDLPLLNSRAPASTPRSPAFRLSPASGYPRLPVTPGFRLPSGFRSPPAPLKPTHPRAPVGRAGVGGLSLLLTAYFLTASLTFSPACFRSPLTSSALPSASSTGSPTALP
jgi:DNA-binding Lrp family transcriptional regulator